MDIYDSIQHYIDVYSGSEKMIIEFVSNECNANINDVKQAISFLLDNNYINEVPCEKKNPVQSDFYDSDCHCKIYENISRFNEIEYKNKVKAESLRINSLSNLEKARYYINKMLDKCHKDNPFAKEIFKIDYDDKNQLIIIIDENCNKDVIILQDTSDWNYLQDCVFYKKNNKYYYIEAKCVRLNEMSISHYEK